MLSRISSRFKLTLPALAFLLLAMPALSNELPTRQASTTWFCEKSKKAKQIPPITLSIVIAKPRMLDLDDIISMSVSARNKGKPMKGVKAEMDLTAGLSLPESEDAIKEASKKTNFGGYAEAVWNDVVMETDNGAEVHKVFVSGTLTLKGNNKLDHVTFDLNHTKNQECVRDIKTACLKDSIRVRGWAQQGNKKVPLDHQSSATQEARLGNKDGNLQILVFDLCKDPTYLSHQIQIRNSLPGKWVVEVYQEGTGWVWYFYPLQSGGSTVNLLNGPPCRGK